MKKLGFIVASLLVLGVVSEADAQQTASDPPKKRYGENGGGIGPEWTWPKVQIINEKGQRSQTPQEPTENQELVIVIE